jgi:hypothetical protein
MLKMFSIKKKSLNTDQYWQLYRNSHVSFYAVIMRQWRHRYVIITRLLHSITPLRGERGNYTHLNTKECLGHAVIGWGTMLQTGMSRVRFPINLFFFNLPNISSRTMVLGLAQSLREISTRNLPGGKGRPVCKAHKLSAICLSIV